MNKEYLRNTQVWVREELDRCVNFWLENGMDKGNGGVYTCLDRTGMGPGELLNCHNVFAVPATAAGCTYLEEFERKLLGKKKVSAVATPLAAYKSGQRSTPILECVKAGMNVALGTGGAIKTMLSVEGIVSTLDHVSGQSGTFQGQITLEILVLLPFLLKLNLVLSRITAGTFRIHITGNCGRILRFGFLIAGSASRNAYHDNQQCDNSPNHGKQRRACFSFGLFHNVPP